MPLASITLVQEGFIRNQHDENIIFKTLLFAQCILYETNKASGPYRAH